MNIQVTGALINSIGVLFKPNEIGSVIIVLQALYNGDLELLDEFDRKNKDKSALLLYKNMELCKLIKKTEDKQHYQLTWSGNQLIEKGCECEEIKKEQSLKDWIEEWRALWKNERGESYKSGNRTLLVSEKEIYERMQKFLSEYAYLFKNHSAKDVIIGATKKYIYEFKKVNFAYCKNSDYFILKGSEYKGASKSVLASECENYIASVNNTATEIVPFSKAL